jgi:hypothetical protein
MPVFTTKTLFYSRRPGILTRAAYEYLKERVHDVLPALGTHDPMSAEQIAHM